MSVKEESLIIPSEDNVEEAPVKVEEVKVAEEVNVAEEVKNPKKTMPIAIILSLLISTILKRGIDEMFFG